MVEEQTENEFDVIVIGSGMGGMSTSAALSRLGHRVLLLEQAQQIGGLTHTFSREGYTWDVGLHYCGMFGHDQFAGKLLDWLSGGSIEFQSIGTVYDTLHFPDKLDIAVGRPAEAYKMELKDHFPEDAAEIDAFFEALAAAEETGHMVTSERAIPEPFRSVHQWWNKKKLDRWCNRTTSEVIEEMITDPKLAAVLSAQWGTYGGDPNKASFAIHATVIGHYLEGASYPSGGADALAKGLIPTVEAAGGSARASTPIQEILVEDSKAVGVRTSSGEEHRAPYIVSAIGAGETVKRLLPADVREQDWAKEIKTFEPSICHFDLYLGFEGDISQYGATRANHWFYESWDTRDVIWGAAEDEPIMMGFVAFSSLKNPQHDPGPTNKHTGDMLVWADWASVAKFVDGGAEQDADEWDAFKQSVETRMLEFFKAKFPALAPLITYHELGTPLATARFTGHEKGGFYGIETSPRRLQSTTLNAKTPVSGLYLTGQDVGFPGIAGSLFGGVLGAAAIDPRVFQHFM